MRLLLVAHKFPPYSLGGVEVYTHHLARALAGARGGEHQVAVFFRHDGVPRSAATLGPRDGARSEGGGATLGGHVPGDSGGLVEHDDEVDGVRVRRVALHPVGLRASVAGEFFGTFVNRDVEASFARFLDLFRPDLVHFQHVMALSARLLPLARRWGARVLLTLHDYWFLCGNSQLIWPDGQTCRGKAWGMNCVRCAAAARFPSPAARALRPALAPLFAYRDRVVRHAALSADKLISPSHFLIDRYLAAGFPAGRLHYLENGLPLGHLSRVAGHPSPGPLRITFLGSIAWQKGVHVLVDALNGLPRGAARLRIWGDPGTFPDYAARLRAAIEAEGSDAEMMGRVANEQVGEVLADSDVVVVPSLWYENSPVVIQEARAAGVPVVAAGHGALVEKVRDGVDGLLFTPGDVEDLRRTLKRLIDDSGLLARLRENVPPAMGMEQHVVELLDLYGRAGS
ncbi:MAG: glycosyltransferase family 4 protein [Anaerolineae bacterium]|nr:glycosyltransferase family 4 protein [Anaerolineae bacterium]